MSIFIYIYIYIYIYIFVHVCFQDIRIFQDIFGIVFFAWIYFLRYLDANFWIFRVDLFSCMIKCAWSCFCCCQTCIAYINFLYFILFIAKLLKYRHYFQCKL